MAQGQVNSETQGDEVYPSVAMDTTGNFVVVWQDGYHPFENSGASIHDSAMTRTAAPWAPSSG